MRRLSVAILTLALAACGQGDSPTDTFEYAVQGAYTAAISPQSRHSLIGSIQHGASLWDISEHERLYNWNHQADSYSSLVAAGFSANGAYALTAEQRSLVRWQVDNGRPAGFWTAPDHLQAVTLSASGRFALLGLANHTAVYVDIENGTLERTLPHQDSVEAVALSDDGRLALTGGDDNQARLWNLDQGEELARISHGNSVNTVAISPSGAWAFSAGQLDKAVIWRTDGGTVAHTLSGPRTFASQRLTYTAAVFSSNSDRLLTGTSAGLIQLWDVKTGSELRRWQAHKRDPFRPTGVTILALGFGSEGRYYALASNGFINELR